MKRAFLILPGQPSFQSDGVCSIDDATLRAAALNLAAFAVNGDTGRNTGDPVFEWVTEGRQSKDEKLRAQGVKEAPYSSCADLAHWMLMCLGCRDEKVINRSGDGGTVPWKMIVNVSRLVGSPWYVVAKPGQFPEPGDITHVANDPGSDHIAVLEDVDLVNGVAHTFDYGQPYGRHCTRHVSVFSSYYVLGNRRLRGWIDLSKVVYAESAVVTDAFSLGITDDNPYQTAPIIPDGI